jgi:repressor LexA
MSESLTPRQHEVLRFIEQTRAREGRAPTLREISAHFQFSSPNAAQSHVRALTRKGVLVSEPGKARTLRASATRGGKRTPELVVQPPLRYPAQSEGVIDATGALEWMNAIRRIPLYGSIPAGFADGREEESDLGCVAVDIRTLGIRPTARTFALKVRGDSMIGRHICDGDIVVCEHGVTPRPGAIVAALIDNESTLKTYVVNRGKPYLKAENPRYPDLLPAHELVIQGVVVTVLRAFKAAG